MTDTSSPAIVVADVVTPVEIPLPFKGLVAVVVGNWLEFYDFLVFTFFAVMIGDAFFPGESEIARLLSALATFGVGFLTRPLGAAIIGAYADRVGRRAALTLTLMLMSLGSGLVALTPTYAQIGLTAPIILVVARLIQGFSCGGEVGPATAYLLESAPIEKRAAMTAWQGHSQQLAIFMGSLVGVILAANLSKEQLYDWGWRVPFLLGVFIAPVGLYIRRQLPETIARHETHRSGAAVLADLMQHHSRAVILGILIICGGTVSTYVFNYMTTYAITTLHLSPTVGTALAMTGSLAAIAGFAVGAWADRFGRKPMLIAVACDLRARHLPGLPHHHLANRICRRDRCAQHVVEFHLLDWDGGVLRVPDGGVSEIRPVERTWHSLRLGSDDIRRYDPVRRGVADRLDKGSDGSGLVSDGGEHRSDRRGHPADATRGSAA